MPGTSEFIKLYHKSSTRYSNSTREFLKKFESLWKKDQPTYIPKSITDKAMKQIVRLLRISSNIYFKEDLLRRAVMLETVAAVPGVVSGFYHHMRSLSTMRHDHWVKITMDEAENERMHLMSLMDLHKTSLMQRVVMISTQATFFAAYFFLYLVSGTAAHRFVGYLEEEAVITYTHFLELLDNGTIENVPASTIAQEYWGLPEDAKLRDLILVIRGDEADHRLTNHAMSDIYAKRTCDYTFDLDLHGPWQSDSIKTIEKVIEKNKNLGKDLGAQMNYSKSSETPQDIGTFKENQKHPARL